LLCLGNVAIDKVEWRNYLLQLQTARAVVDLYCRLGKSADIDLLKQIAWTLGNLVLGEPAPHLSHISLVLPVLCDLLQSANEALLARALRGLSYIAKGGLACVQMVVNANCLATAVHCVAHSNRLVHLPAVNLVGQVSTGEYEHTEALFALNILDKLCCIIMSSHSEVRRLTYWVLSNLTADSPSQACRVVNSPILYPALKGLTDTNQDVRLEASYVFRNISFEATAEQATTLLSVGIVPIIKEALDCEADPQIILNLIEVAAMLLYYGEREAAVNPISEEFCELGMTDVFNQLLSHENDEVERTVKKIIRRYFEVVDDELAMEEERPEQFQFS
jgi:hypothetical protein